MPCTPAGMTASIVMPTRHPASRSASLNIIGLDRQNRFTGLTGKP